MLQSNKPYQNADRGVSWGGIFGMAAVAGAGVLGFRHRGAITGYMKNNVSRAANDIWGGTKRAATRSSQQVLRKDAAGSVTVPSNLNIPPEML